MKNSKSQIPNFKQILNFPIENRDPDHLKYSKKGKIGAKFQILNSRAGFTLAELLVAMTIAILLLGTVYAIYLVGQKSFKFGAEKTETTQNARIGLQKIVRELRETNEIATTLPANEITFRDANYSKIRYINYYLAGNDLNRRIYHYYVDNPSEWVAYNTPGVTQITDDDSIIATSITKLEFDGQETITINLSAQSGSGIIDLTTKVNPRNI